MIISVNWLKKFTPVNLPIDELATLIGARLVEVEDTIDLGAKYKDVVIAKVVECAPLEGSDHLNLTKIDDGGVVADIERDERGLVQVVCGAPNVHAGLMVAWLPPRAVVPETFDDPEPFMLGARKLRGAMSNGMLASAKELDLFEDHTGILELSVEAVPGDSFAKVFELDDYLLDIENKSLTHRPDTFGVIGFAREVAAIQGVAFETPAWLEGIDASDWIEMNGNLEAPSVTIEDPELSARYQAVVLGDIDATRHSSLELQTLLARVGVRPISAVVDVTNYMMLVTGQPLHAFDYDKLKAVNDGVIDMRVRAGHEGEKLALLDGREIELSSDDIVIANGETPVALAGAMGGALTEVDESTTTILLESATFDLYHLRNTQMRHGIFSEAITRFTKGQPAALTAPVLAEAMDMLRVNVGAVRLSDVADIYPNRAAGQTIDVAVTQINATLGSTFDVAEVVRTLANAGIHVKIADEVGLLTVHVPYWRSDLHIPEDIIEEVGRLNGFDSIRPTLPTRPFKAVSPSEFDALRSRLRDVLVRAGANEVLTFSFVHGDVLKKVGQDPTKSYRITNSISPDLQYYRQSLTPSLLGLVHANIKKGFDDFAVFELNKVHSKGSKLVEDGVPAELHRLGLVLAQRKGITGAPYYRAKKLVDYLGEALGLELTYKPFASEPNLAFMRPFEYRRSARIVDAASGQSIGIVGEYKKSVSRNFKLPEYAAGFELLPEAIALATAHVRPRYTPLSRFPATDRDICFQVANEVTYAQVAEAAHIALRDCDYETTLEPLDIYRAEGADVKHVTIRIRLVSHERTLTGEDAAAVIDRVAAEVTAATNAVVV